jgi:hypothetical protein
MPSALFREMYVRRMDLSNIEARIVRDVDPERFRKITSSTLEGLAKRELNLGALLGKSAEARERRLIPEVIEDFFVAAGPITGVHSKPIHKDGHVFADGRRCERWKKAKPCRVRSSEFVARCPLAKKRRSTNPIRR